MGWGGFSRLSVAGATWIAMSVFGGCLHERSGIAIPDPPVIPLVVIYELEQGACPLARRHLYLEVEGYFAGLRAMGE